MTVSHRYPVKTAAIGAAAGAFGAVVGATLAGPLGAAIGAAGLIAASFLVSPRDFFAPNLDDRGRLYTIHDHIREHSIAYRQAVEQSEQDRR